MNDDSTADVARKKFARAVKNYAPKMPRKLQKLLPYKVGIAELRRKGASYETIVHILHDVNIAVSRDTLTRFCCEVLELTPPRREKCGAPARITPPRPRRQLQTTNTGPEHRSESGGPRIANPDDI
jgi:hypothetical protein